MRVVGNQKLNRPPATPEEAWQRGRVLDAMLPCRVALPQGVSRFTHAQRNAQDDERTLMIARALNTAAITHGQT